MNKYLQDYLISPETGKFLSLGDASEDEIQSGQLIGNDPSDLFHIVNGIPILLPHNQIADYNHNILDLLFKERTNEICDTIREKHSKNYELYEKELDNYILKEYGKEGILRAYEEHSKLSKDQKLTWYATLDQGQNGKESYQIPTSALNSGLSYATSENGKKRLETTESMINTWACHLMDYAKLVTESKPDNIVELATGSGFGTCGVINSGLGESKLISIDIDYACAANAVGIAKYLGLEEQVDAMVANFWFLPFKERSVDVVCSHYGLDEAREVNRILSEIGRILKPGGKFINVSRKDLTIRMRKNFGHIDFTEEEYRKLATYAGFYCGMEELVKEAKKNDLVFEYHKIYSPNHSHERIISVFRKI